MGPNDPMRPAGPPPPPVGGSGPGEPLPPRHHEDVMNALREIRDILVRIAAKVGA